MILHNVESEEAFTKTKRQESAASFSDVEMNNFSVQMLGKIN